MGALTLRTITHPQEAFWRDRCKNTALHLACRKQPPIASVAALLEVNRKSASLETVDGMTPLHFACYCGASSDVVKLLIEANSEVASRVDRRGRTPLHCACVGYKTSHTNEVVRELLKV